MEQEISMKNTKAEMLEALNAALVRAEAAEKGKLFPEKTEKEKVEKKAIESAKTAVDQNVFSTELNNKFKDLQIAIAAEEARLQELYDVSVNLQKLALVIESGRERQEKIEAENNDKIEEAKTNIESLKTDYAQKKIELQEEYDNLAKKLKIDRSREAEEFQYNLKREREKESNAWGDEKAARELVLARKEAEIQAVLEDTNNKLEYIKTLETKVESIPALIESEKKQAVALAISELTKEYDYKTKLSEKDFESSLNRQNDKIAYLEKELDLFNKTNTALQNKLDKAYAELRELATKTVESASGVKIIGSGGDLQ
ncbi:MAG: hypothetical protein FWC09_03510 [Lachnospiraceae bacterium]|nr:hypothetical protein [Lachnospiraceae bacterium]